MDSQVAQNRMSQRYDQGSKFDSKEPSRMIVGEASTEQTNGELPEPQRSVEQRRRPRSVERLKGS